MTGPKETQCRICFFLLAKLCNFQFHEKKKIFFVKLKIIIYYFFREMFVIGNKNMPLKIGTFQEKY